MQELRSVVLIDRGNVATRYIREWLENPVGLEWLRQCGHPLIQEFELEELQAVRKQVVEDGRLGMDADVIQTMLNEAVNVERSVLTPLLVIDPPQEHDQFCLMMMDSVLGSITNTVIPRYERGWFYNIAVGYSPEQPRSEKAPRGYAWTGLYLAFNNKALAFETLHKGLELTVPVLHEDITVFSLMQEGDPDPKVPFGFTRVHAPGGVLESHSYLAAICPTESMMVLDGDCRVTQTPTIPNRLNKTYLYSALNPYNGLEYGHGGIKIFRRQDVLSVNRLTYVDDFLMSVGKAAKNGLTVLDEVCSVHAFATTRKRGAITAFREAYKLSEVIDSDETSERDRQEARERLQVWTNPNAYLPGAEYMADAAQQGRSLRRRNDGGGINDWKYLHKIFDDNGVYQELKVPHTVS